jgi:hypothetical protein
MGVVKAGLDSDDTVRPALRDARPVDFAKGWVILAEGAPWPTWVGILMMLPESAPLCSWQDATSCSGACVARSVSCSIA